MAKYQLDLVRADRERWLKQYYFVRAAFSVAWVAAAFAAGASSSVIAGALLVLISDGTPRLTSWTRFAAAGSLKTARRL